MNRQLTIVFTLLAISSFGQQKQYVDLYWKIGNQEKLSYLTVMNELDTSSIDLNFNGLFKSFSDSTGKELFRAKEFFKKINASFKNVELITTLTNKSKGIIDIVVVANRNKNVELTTDTTNQKQKEIIKAIQNMNQGVMLRGSVYATGGIHSFWIKNAQKNLLSILFELPARHVRVGDSWTLDVNLISNDENFACDSSVNINKVSLVDIKKMNGENIAVLKYDIVEYVNGTFNMPSTQNNGGGQIKTMMKFTYNAIAEFSIDKGRWISYDGLMTLGASGVMTANKKTKFTLIKV